MTKTIRFGAAGIAMFAALGMGSAAHAQDTATADAFAEVLDALDLSRVEGALDFGAIVVDGADTLVLQPNGTMDCTNKQVVCSGTTDTPLFLVTGTDGKAVTINLPTSAVTLDLQGGTGQPGETMTVDSFTTDAAGDEVTLGASGTAGAENFSLGATLNIGATQSAGIYEGEVSISVDYS